MEFLYRAESYVDESFQSYIARLAYWNGFAGEKQLLKSVLSWHRSKYGKLEWEWLRDCANYNLNDRAWYECRHALECIFKRNLPAIELIPGDAGPGRGQQYTEQHWICEKCWEVDQYYRVYWYMHEYRVCHMHDTPLVVSFGYQSEIERQRRNVRTLKNPEKEKSKLLVNEAVRYFSTSENIIHHIYRAIWESQYLPSVMHHTSSICNKVLGLSVDSSSILRACKSGEYVGMGTPDIMDSLSLIHI